MGYSRAGFDVVGVDICAQPRFPFPFIQADAIEFCEAHGHEFDAIHASPPCQKHIKGLGAVNAVLGRVSRHSDLIADTRNAVRQFGVPYVIENVVGAPLISPIELCGSSFGLAVRRHRRFESNVLLLALDCDHSKQNEARYWTSWRPNGEKRMAFVVQVYGNAGDRSRWNEAMGIDWMEWPELREAIPPAYTEFIGRQLLQAVSDPASADAVDPCAPDSGTPSTRA